MPCSWMLQRLLSGQVKGLGWRYGGGQGFSGSDTGAHTGWLMSQVDKLSANMMEFSDVTAPLLHGIHTSTALDQARQAPKPHTSPPLPPPPAIAHTAVPIPGAFPPRPSAVQAPSADRDRATAAPARWLAPEYLLQRCRNVSQNTRQLGLLRRPLEMQGQLTTEVDVPQELHVWYRLSPRSHKPGLARGCQAARGPEGQAPVLSFRVGVVLGLWGWLPWPITHLDPGAVHAWPWCSGSGGRVRWPIE